ncbi:MAG: TatD family hydrolase [Nitrospirota bacterium]
MIVDTHAHLDMEQFKEDLPEVLARAKEAGVKYIITIGTDIKSSRAARLLAETYDNVYFSSGFHPHDVKSAAEEDYAEIFELLNDPKAVAVGEIGLDYHYDLSPRDTQVEHFKRQLQISNDVNKPVIIHSREAEKETMDVISSVGLPEAGGTLHCFSGGLEMARRALDLGMYISVGGTLTFNNADPLRDVIKTVPIERLLLETDCPYLAPKPLRGKRNEPSYLKYVVDTLARLKGLSPEDVMRITSLNATRLFGVCEPPSEGQIAYPIRDSLYLNITNRCTNACVFCVRNTTDFVKGHNLRIKNEPSVEEILSAMEGLGFERYREVVFCGYGEPFLRLDAIKRVAKAVKAKGVRVRINTNGHALLIHGDKFLPEIKGLVDAISVSLNFPSEAQYEEYCKPEMDGAYESLKEFVVRAKAYVPDITVTALAMPGVDIDECRRIAADELGVKLRVREYDEVG